MSTATKGFIPIDGNPYKALNQVVHEVYRLLNRNYPRNPNASPFHFKGMNPLGPDCFFLNFTNDLDEGKLRMIQIGYYQDQRHIRPRGNKISLSVGAWGDSEHIMKACLAQAMETLGKRVAFYQATDYDDNFERLTLKGLKEINN